MRSDAVRAVAAGAALCALAATPQAAAVPSKVVVTEVKGGAAVASVDVFPDGSAGVVATSKDKIIVAKYKSNGHLNTDYGTDGIATVPLPKTTRAAAAAIAVTSGGKVVVTGSTTGGDAVVARLTAGGRTDTTFNGTGYNVTDLGGSDAATGLALGKAGEPYLLANTKGDFAVVKYCSGQAPGCPAGTVDTRYGTSGITRIDFNKGTDASAAIAARSNGRVVVIGTTQPAGKKQSAFAMAGLTPAGRLDTAFATDGKAVINDARAIRTGPAIALDSTERILVSGTLDGRFALARYTPAGKVDTTFADTGIARPSLKGTGTSVGVYNAEITTVGTTTADGKATALRYTAAGNPVTRYGNGGKAQAPLGGGTKDSIAGVVLDSAGRAILAGTTNNKIAILRYTTTGTLDPNYGA
ncbi:hypothetical protein [Streptomyces qinzhouensis]|uniref:hypothetical protein n=1 Tax=Streptomyces qinzhouensis TaxID=2599401 RepID=UPI00164520EF|nr:hypothetical protein [Streptomyces qinzhouensis]